MDLQHGSSYQDVTSPVSTGTTILVVSYTGGVILGADSRTSTGAYVANRAADKITPLSENVYVCRSGSAADTQAISHYIQHFVAQHQAERAEPVEVATVAKLAGNMTYNNKNALSAGLIVAGWDQHEGGSVWSIPQGGTLVQQSYAMGGSGSAYIYGYCDKYFRAGMTEAEAHAFVVKAIGYAMARDSSSGGCIRTVTVDSAGVRRKFLPGNQLPLAYGEET